MPCEVKNCDREVVARGWCSAHYNRWRKNGDVQADKPVREIRPNRGCEIEGCENEHQARGWCMKHYRRWYDHDDPHYQPETSEVHQGLKKWVYRGTKKGSCLDCGENYPFFVMDLDHVFGEKEASPAKMAQEPYTIDELVQEIGLCEPVCSNCHRYRSYA